MRGNGGQFLFQFYIFPYHVLDQGNKRFIKIKRGQNPDSETKASICGSPDRPSRSWSAWFTSASVPSWGLSSWGTILLFHSTEAFPSGEASGWVIRVTSQTSSQKVPAHSGPPCQVVPCRFPAKGAGWMETQLRSCSPNELLCLGCPDEYHWLGNLHNRNVVSHSSRGQRSEIKVPAGLVSAEASHLG